MTHAFSLSHCPMAEPRERGRGREGVHLVPADGRACRDVSSFALRPLPSPCGNNLHSRPSREANRIFPVWFLVPLSSPFLPPLPLGMTLGEKAPALESLVKRLEAVASRLEGTGGGSAAPAAAAAAAPAATGGAGAGVSSASVDGFKALVDGHVAKLVSTAAAIGDADVVKTTGFLSEAFNQEAQLVAAIASCKKPDMQTLQALLKPTADQIGLCYDFAGDRKNKAFQHTKVASECLQGLTWVAYMPGSGASMPTKTVQVNWAIPQRFSCLASVHAPTLAPFPPLPFSARDVNCPVKQGKKGPHDGPSLGDGMEPPLTVCCAGL